MKTFEQFINETPENIYPYDLNPFSKDAIAFSCKVINNFVLVVVGRKGRKGEHHFDISKNNNTLYEYEGRLWLNNKIMSFWNYPSDEIFIKIIDELEKKLKMKIWNNDWKIEVIILNDTNKIITNYSFLNFELTPEEQEKERENKHIKIIPIEDYLQSEDPPDELRKIHLMNSAEKDMLRKAGKDPLKYYKSLGKNKNIEPIDILKNRQLMYQEMKTFEEFVNESTIGDLFKNQVELFISNEKTDKQLFIDCQNLGKKILENNGIVIKCKNYIKSCFTGMGYKNLTDENIELKFYEPEKVIVAIIPDGVLKSFGKTGQSVSMRHTNIIVFEKTQWENDIEKWIEHEVGHVVSWRDYKDMPKIKNKFITGSKFGANDNVFDPKYCFGHTEYPNVWFEYIPFTRQIKYLLKSNNPENIIRLIMKDYELGHTPEDLVKYEQIFINYLNVVLNKNSGVKNKYQK